MRVSVEYTMYCAVPPPRESVYVLWLSCGCVAAIRSDLYRPATMGVLKDHHCPNPPKANPDHKLRGLSATMVIADEVGDAPRQEQGLPPHPKGLPESNPRGLRSTESDARPRGLPPDP